MWQELIKHLGSFSSSVLTGLDVHGYPYSIRCLPDVDSTREVLRIQVYEGCEILPGLGCLLCHSHDVRIWNLKSFTVKGEIEREGEIFIFRPHQFIPGMGIGGVKSYLRFVMDGRRNAKRYLEQRGLQRPRVDWGEMEKLMAFEKNGGRQGQLHKEAPKGMEDKTEYDGS